MPSSTSRHASFDRWLLAALFTGIIGAPVVWLAALQTGYTLAYQACDERSTSWVSVPTFAAVALTTVIAAASWAAHQRARRDRVPMPLLGEVAVGVAVLMVIVLIASAIAPVMLYPCD
jgi:hypothetical protein